MLGHTLRWAPLILLVLVFFYPLGTILAASFQWAADSPLTLFQEVLTDSFFMGRLWFTTWQAALSTALTLLIGIPSAYLFAQHEFPGKTFLKSLTTIPFVMPPIVMALGFIALLGPRGIVNNALVAFLGLDEPPIQLTNTVAIILMAHVTYEYTIVVRLVSALWANLDPRLEASARVLGAGPWTSFVRVTLPLLMPAITAAALLVFLFTFTSFGVVLILGGSQYATLEVTIYTLTAKLFQPPVAAALALVQMVVTFIVMVVYSRVQEATAAQIQLTPVSHRKPVMGMRSRVGWRGRLLLSSTALTILLIVSPLIALAVRAIWGPEGPTLDAFQAIASNKQNSYFFISPVAAMRNSLVFALATVIIALPLGTAAAYTLARGRAWWKSPMDGVYMLPLGVSAVTLGLGFLIGFGHGPLDLRATWVIIVLAHVLVAYPFVLRASLSTLRSIKPELRASARVLGASPARAFRYLDLPILRPALLVGATFAFAISMGEFGATLILNRPEYATMPVAIFRFLGQPGAKNLAEALAMSTVLMVTCGIGFVIIERFRHQDIGEF